ncbi:small CPxCG-related zinc finger protein [Natronomonas pharaonis DSM 2160]|uniref:Small CPxCG-related zinc finger protein n=1 Tax=Natronomonas pharaonis (strain ATCC 35678 / DSM 2160 / CIP 103997 / JCM 8858 / NBRC 14720 / NCIMB 2260 / Gabara) TaxID=348780 RepID=A0A1U7ETJ2_NATPD|nr:DUF6276 family protein [Natronomonas pharaonis]CAI48225.1 small CPxCG-related zinc finger protein [Natronomonas pharaonis DSM 2160]
MNCPSCDVPLVVFDVPVTYRDYIPEGAERAGLCPECLALAAAEDAAAESRFERITSSFPTDEDAAVPLAIAVGLLDSLALNRQALEELLTDVESAGVDPLLVLDRLHVQGGTNPEFDIERRRHQLTQLLD